MHLNHTAVGLTKLKLGMESTLASVAAALRIALCSSLRKAKFWVLIRDHSLNLKFRSPQPLYLVHLWRCTFSQLELLNAGYQIAAEHVLGLLGGKRT
jgi:hypothetical protein